MSAQRLIRVDLYSKNAAGTDVIHRYATYDYVTASAATPSKTHIEGRLQQPGLMTRSMYGGTRTMGDIPMGDGAIILANPDGALDGLIDYAFDGQEFRLIEIDPATGNTSTYGSNFRVGFIEQATFSEDQVVFAVRDGAHALDAALLTSKYAGTNALPAGVEGTPDDIKGQPKPICIGTVYNISPVCVNTSKLIYQVDAYRGFTSGYTMTVYDKRAALTEDGAGDYASQAAMEATAPAAGQYRIWPAGGMIRLGSTPEILTIDMENPADVSGLGDSEINYVTQEITTLSGGISSWQALYDADAKVGIYAKDETTIYKAINELAASIGAFVTYGYSPNGATGNTLWSSQLAEASAIPYTPTLTAIALNESNILEGSLRRVVPQESTRGLPVWRVNLNYKKNYTVMSRADLAGVALADVEFATREYRTVTVSDAAVKTQWPYAPELNVTTLLVDETEATAEANRLLDLFGVQRSMFELTIPASVIRDDPSMGTGGRIPYLFQIGAIVTITYPRFDLDAGPTFMVVATEEDIGADTIKLTVWG